MFVDRIKRGEIEKKVGVRLIMSLFGIKLYEFIHCLLLLFCYQQTLRLNFLQIHLSFNQFRDFFLFIHKKFR